jgi:uncharacterized membrane protein
LDDVGELTGGLIQMNCHMRATDAAAGMIAVGFIVAVLFMWCGFASWGQGRRIGAAVLFAVALAGAAVAVAGVCIPREKIVRACACGPVSLEMVATRYDIIEVDGKELVLRVR